MLRFSQNFRGGRYCRWPDPDFETATRAGDPVTVTVAQPEHDPKSHTSLFQAQGSMLEVVPLDRGLCWLRTKEAGDICLTTASAHVLAGRSKPATDRVTATGPC